MKYKNAFIFLPWMVGLAMLGVGALTVNYVRVLNDNKNIPMGDMVDNVLVKDKDTVVVPDEASVYLETDQANFLVNKKNLVKLIVDTTKSARKVDFLEAGVCWNQGSLKIADENKDVVLGKDDSFSDIVMTKVVNEGQNDCLYVYVKSERTSSELKSGKMGVVDINFTGLKASQGVMFVNKEKTKLSGPPVDERRYKIGIGEVGEFRYFVN
jgi:hypothetical protein